MSKKIIFFLQIVLLVFLLAGCDLFNRNTTTAVNTEESTIPEVSTTTITTLLPTCCTSQVSTTTNTTTMSSAPSTDKATIISAMDDLLAELALDATADSYDLMISIHLEKTGLVFNATTSLEINQYYADFMFEIMLAYERDYVRIDFEYAKSTSTDQMEASIDMLQIVVMNLLWDDFAVREVLEEYVALIDDATDIETVDTFLEAFIVDMTAAIIFEGTPPTALVIGFKVGIIAHLHGVRTNINAAGDEIGIIAVSDTYMTSLETMINQSYDIPDIIEFTFHGIRQMFQDLSEASRGYFTTQVTAAYSAVISLLDVAMQNVLTDRYDLTIELIDTLHFYEDIAMVTQDFIDFIELITS